MTEAAITLESLKTDVEALSLERRSGRFSFKSVAKQLPEYFNKVRSFITSPFSSGEIQHFAKVDDKAIDRAQKKIAYTDIRFKRVIVPVGLTSDYLSYLTDLLTVQGEIDRLIPDVLTPFEQYVGSLLMDPDRLSSERPTDLINRLSDRKVDEYKTLLSRHFGKQPIEHRKYGDVVKRHADWSKITAGYNDLIERYHRIDQNIVLEKVESITDGLDSLVEAMKEDPETYRLSGLTMDVLARLTYHLALEVEHYAMHGYAIEALGASISDAERVLLD